MAKKWIQEALQKKKAPHSASEGETIGQERLEEASKGSGNTAKRAKLALTLRKFVGKVGKKGKSDA